MPKRNGPGIELLADPTRRRIIAALALRPRRPSSIAAEIGLSRAAISRQLSLMIEAGLVEVRRPYHDRRSRLYVIDAKTKGQIIAWLAGTDVGRPQVQRPPEAAKPTEPRQPGESTARVDVRPPIDYDDPVDLDELLDL